MRKVCTLAVATGIVLATHGAMAQCCGDCNVDNEVTVDEIITSVNRALNGCEDDGVCAGQGGANLLATGLTDSYGPGSDGDVQAGVPLAYEDNGDGTVTDLNTGLIWEKKDDSGGVHDKDNLYTWGMTGAPYAMKGTMERVFLAALNTPPCFAGHCDWRIPNVRELQSIVDYQIPSPGPVTDAALHAETCPGCVDLTDPSCSCTAPGYYWSSTTYSEDPSNAWFVEFDDGGVRGNAKNNGYHVRAVRGGA